MNQGYNWESATTRERHLNLQRIEVDEAWREVIAALAECVSSEEPKDFELLKSRIFGFNKRLRWLAEAESDALNEALFIANEGWALQRKEAM